MKSWAFFSGLIGLGLLLQPGQPGFYWKWSLIEWAFLEMGASIGDGGVY